MLWVASCTKEVTATMTHAMFVLLVVTSPGRLDHAAGLLAAFKVEEALAELTAAKQESPHDLATHVRMYELLGIAHAYLDQTEQAHNDFIKLLTLDRGHAISYTLSPKVTFVFEKAKREAQAWPPPRLNLTWPHGLAVNDPIPVSIEVVSGPKGFFERGRLKVRLQNGPELPEVDLTLPAVGSYLEHHLPALAPEATAPQTADVYFSAYDVDGNEVYQEGNASQPRILSLSYVPPVPWYRQWWLWASVGVAAAAITGAAVYASTRELPDRVNGQVAVTH